MSQPEYFTYGSLFTKKEHFRSVESELAQKLAQEASEKALKEVTEKSIREAAERAAKETAERAAREATQRASKEAAERAAKEASERASLEAAQKTAKETAEKTSKETIEKTTKEATEKATKESSEKAAKETIEKEAKDSFLKKNSGKIVGGVAAATAAAVAYDRFSSRDGTPSDIINIYQEDGKVVVEYATELSFCINDKATIEGSDSIPSIDGNWGISSIESKTKIILDKSVDSFDKDGTKGVIKIDTSFESQLSCTVAESAGKITGTAAGVLGSAFQNISKQLGLDKLFSQYKIYFYIIAAIIIFGIIYKIYDMFFKSDTVIVQTKSIASRLFGKGKRRYRF
jgi:flagellar biosynthesis GTPase FlhF